MGTGAGNDVVEREKSPSPAGIRTPDRPGRSLGQNYNFYEKPNVSNGTYTNNKQYRCGVNTSLYTTERDTCLLRGVCYLCTAKCYFDLIYK